MADGVTLNEGTQTKIATDEVGGTQYQVVKLDYGTDGVSTPFEGTIPVVSSIANLAKGTVTRVEGGSIVVTAGTVVATLGDLEGGTIDLVTGITTLSNLSAGSVAVVAGTVNVTAIGADLPGGTVDLVTGITTVSNVSAGSIAVVAGTIGAFTADIPGGTIDNVGTVVGLGTIANIAKVHNAGTIAGLPNLPGGSIAVIAGTGIVTSGSISVIAGTVSAGTINAGTVNAGTIDLLKAGTITKLEQGSVNVTAGTVSAGTINIGTVKDDGRPARNILTYGTTFAGTAAAYGTLVGSAAVGAGTSLWVQDISVNNAGANVTITVGLGTVLNGTSVLLKGVYGTTSAVGHEKSFAKAVNAGMVNQDLVVHVSAAATVNVNTSYFISA